MENYGEILIYQTEDGLTKIDVNMQDENVWLSLDQMASLFQRDKSTISKHIKHIFDEGELVRASTVAKFATVQNEGDRKVERTIEYFNLDVVISVGYRVKSQRGVQFRIWATNILKEYIKKGFAMDDDRLKELGGGGYLDFAERQAEREIPMTMEDWAKQLDGILTSTGENLLTGNGTVIHIQAMDKAQAEYKKYKARTLSSVEEDYLDSIKMLEKKA